MKESVALSLALSNYETDEMLLVQNDAYIQAEARKLVPSNLFKEEVLDLETDEFAQNIRIKLWVSSQKQPITHPKAYIRTIARTTVIDIARCQRPTLSLNDDTDEGLFLNDCLVARSEGFQDPAYELEVREIDPDLLTKLVEIILALPPRQRQSMLFFLKKHRDEVLPLINAFKSRAIDIDTINLPKEACEEQRLRASLSIVRKKLRYLLKSAATL